MPPGVVSNKGVTIRAVSDVLERCSVAGQGRRSRSTDPRGGNAIAVIPGIVRGRDYPDKGILARGFMVLRNTNGWSSPAFVSLEGPHPGKAIGRGTRGILFVFKNREPVDSMEGG